MSLQCSQDDSEERDEEDDKVGEIDWVVVPVDKLTFGGGFMVIFVGLSKTLFGGNLMTVRIGSRFKFIFNGSTLRLSSNFSSEAAAEGDGPVSSILL